MDGSVNAWSGEMDWGCEDWVHTPQAVNPSACVPDWIIAPINSMPAETGSTSKKNICLPEECCSSSPSPPGCTDDTPMGMRMQLQALQEADPGTVLIARRIHRLGFNSAQKLSEHFLSYGEVREVLVPHSRVKASPGRRARTRPAAIGFIVMASSDVAELALAGGSEHVVEGVQVNVQAFERRQNSEPSEDGIDTQCGGSSFGSPESLSKAPRWADIEDDADDVEHSHVRKEQDLPPAAVQKVPEAVSVKVRSWADASDEFMAGNDMENLPKNIYMSSKATSDYWSYGAWDADAKHSQDYTQQRGSQWTGSKRWRQQGRGRANRGRA